MNSGVGKIFNVTIRVKNEAIYKCFLIHKSFIGFIGATFTVDMQTYGLYGNAYMCNARAHFEFSEYIEMPYFFRK